jgi:Winged helix DNA-binding domain
MSLPLSDEEILLLRMRGQRLIGHRVSETSAVVRDVFALQAQDTRASRLQVRARSERLDRDGVIRACNEERSVVRTWAMRGSLHMLPAADLGWVVGLLGPIFASRDRRRRLQLALTDDLCARALPAMRQILAGGPPLSRAELVRRLGEKGVKIEPRGQAPAHLLFYAATQGLICRGPDLSDEEATWVLAEEWVGRPAATRLEPDAGLAELARRFLDAYGPADAGDFAAWSGLPAPQAHRTFQLIAGEIRELPRAGAAPLVVRLLPSFDAYLLGYRRRDLMLDPRFASRIRAGGGWIHPVVLVDGKVAGTWRMQAAGTRATVVVRPFARLAPEVVPRIEAEAADIGRFLGAAPVLKIEE